MAATSTPSLTDSHTVPDWIERNSQLFGALPPGIDRSTRRAAGSTVPIVGRSGGEEEHAEGEEEDVAACMAAMTTNTEHGVGWIDAPVGLQPASYYRDLANHPNILATFVYTARRRAGFLTGIMGQQLTSQQWDDFISKFNAWLNELDAFWFYLPLTGVDTWSTANAPATGDAIVDRLSEIVLKTTNEGDEEARKDVRERIKRTVELAAEYMAEKTTSESSEPVKVGLQHEAFPAPGPSNPAVPISFTTTTLAKEGGTLQFGPTATMNSFVFQLNSNNIIANAAALAAGTTVLSTKAYCDYVNAPLEEWAKISGATSARAYKSSR